jgi:hypothetical protein
MQSCSCLRWTLFFSSSTVSEFISKRLCFLQILEKKLRMSSIVRIKYDYDRSTILLQYCKWELFIFRPQRQLSLFLCSSGAPSSVPLSLSKLVDDDNTSRRHCGNHMWHTRLFHYPDCIVVILWKEAVTRIYTFTSLLWSWTLSIDLDTVHFLLPRPFAVMT